MQELVREYLSNVKSRRKRRRRITITIAVFAVLVVGSVVWSLARMGIAMTGDPKCGVEEHTHSDACYTDTLVCGMEESAGHTHSDACYQTESTLVCGMEESEEHVHDESCYAASQTLICGQEESAGHTHTDACHDKALSCGKAEHTHTEDCFIDSGADVEDASVWDAQYAGVEWKDAWGENLAAAAQMQVGYKESTKNYIVAEDGSHKGYTRYGQFVGDAYADWDAPFVNFCLHYAGLEASNMFPNEKVTAQWYDTFVKANEENQKYLTAPAGYEPKPGDIIFFHKEGEETDTQMGIVSSYDKEKNEIKVIEGNSGNEVKENKYDIGDQHISSYMMVTEMEKAFKPSDAGEGSAEENTEAPEDTSQIFTTEENAEETWAYENSYEDDTIVIHVRAGEGVVPEGAELSVTPIEQKEVTSDMTEEEAAEAEKVNEQYELTNQKLQEESEKKQETLEGFLAYDICFIVDGEEVEPSGDVKVTMDFKEATKPEGVSENAVVAVKHLKSDDKSEDGIKVEDLTAEDTTTIVTAEEDISVEKVELVTDSFSVFIITYNYMGQGVPQIPIEIVDENDNVLPYEKNIVSSEFTENISYNLAEQFEPQIRVNGEYYVFDSVYIVDSTTSEEQIYEVENLKMQGFTYVFVLGETEHVYNMANVMNNQAKLRLKYRKDEAIGIEDHVKEEGVITVVGGDKIKKQYTDSGYSFRYVWMKQEGNNNETEVESIRYGEEYTVSPDGESLNIALDGGGLTNTQRNIKYRVKLEVRDSNNEIVKSVWSEPFSVPYNSEIINGSFERPDDRSLVYDNGQCFVGMDEVDGWNTTAGDHRIEIVRNTWGKLNYDYAEDFFADEGHQFAEINATSEGALYQDVLTFKDRPLDFYFSHRARKLIIRGNKDPNAGPIKEDVFQDRSNEMFVVIAPTYLAESGLNENGNAIDTNEEVKALRAAIKNPEGYSEKVKEALKGARVYDYSTWSGAWKKYHDVYTPTSHMTRFFFVSNQPDTQSMGNFVDRIYFGQKGPDPTENTFNLTVKKTIEGLEGATDKLEELKNKLTFEIEIKDQSGNYVKDEASKNGLLTGNKVIIEASNMRWYPDKNGSFTGECIYTGNLINGTYTISVKEQSEVLENYDVNTTAQSVVIAPQVDGTDTVINNVTTATTNIQERQEAVISYTNTYTEKDIEPEAKKSIRVVKKWEDFENAYGTRDNLTLQLTLKGQYTDASGSTKSITQDDFKDWNIEPQQTVSGENGEWGYIWSEVPVYYNNDKRQSITWSVEENVMGNNASKYQLAKYESSQDVSGDTFKLIKENSDVSQKADEIYTITNALKSDAIEWSMVKYSTSGHDTEVTLSGASFELIEDSLMGTVVATGNSVEMGVISWKQKDGTDGLIGLTGSYRIVEKQAPEGFSRNTGNGWKVELVDGIPKISENYTNIKMDGPTDGKLVIYIGNTPLYSLPESGGSGIYLYMFSGILLMAVAVLITYKNKKRRKGVLRS